MSAGGKQEEFVAVVAVHQRLAFTLWMHADPTSRSLFLPSLVVGSTAGRIDVGRCLLITVCMPRSAGREIRFGSLPQVGFWVPFTITM